MPPPPSNWLSASPMAVLPSTVDSLILSVPLDHSPPPSTAVLFVTVEFLTVTVPPPVWRPPPLPGLAPPLFWSSVTSVRLGRPTRVLDGAACPVSGVGDECRTRHRQRTALVDQRAARSASARRAVARKRRVLRSPRYRLRHDRASTQRAASPVATPLFGYQVIRLEIRSPVRRRSVRLLRRALDHADIPYRDCAA